jgi:hypothetical protein
LRSHSTANIKIALLLMLTVSVLYSVLPMVRSAGAIRPAWGSLSATAGSGSITVLMSSPQQINGVTGQFVKVTGMITNAGLNENVSGLAYISLVDTQNRAPLDLEDWSASRGIYVASIAHGQSVSVEWDVRLVKAGSYSIAILFSQDGISPPIASSKILLEVAPKRNLNPDNVLPVAFGTPALLIGIFLAITFIRGKKMGIYS